MTIYNFSAGPAVLPKEVLKRAQAEFLDYEETGMSVMELSHRSRAFDDIIKDAEKLLRELMAIPDNYKVLFLQGGASTQFSMIPLNLALGKKAYYLVAGSWGKKAYTEAVKLSKTLPFEPILLASSEEDVYTHIPRFDPAVIDPKAAYVHVTKLRILKAIFSVNRDHLAMELGHQPSAGEIRHRFFERFGIGVKHDD